MEGAAAAPSARISATDPAVAASRTTDLLFIGALFTVTFTKLQWAALPRGIRLRNARAINGAPTRSRRGGSRSFV
jgi:hypothetical protein